MRKLFLYFILFFFVYSCSFDSKSTYWNNKNKIVIVNQVTKDNKMSNYKNEIIEYGKKSNFPDLKD